MRSAKVLYGADWTENPWLAKINLGGTEIVEELCDMLLEFVSVITGYNKMVFALDLATYALLDIQTEMLHSLFELSQLYLMSLGLTFYTYLIYPVKNWRVK